MAVKIDKNNKIVRDDSFDNDPLATHLRPDLDRLEDMDQVDEKIEIKIDRAAEIFCKGLGVGLFLGSILTAGVFFTCL